MPGSRCARTALPVVATTLAAVFAGTGAAAGQDAPSPGSITPPLSPAITEIESVWKRNGRVKLRAEAVPRGAEVVEVVFRYRGKRFKARGVGQWRYVKTVKPRGRDRHGDMVDFKVRACTATRCARRSTRDDVR